VELKASMTTSVTLVPLSAWTVGVRTRNEVWGIGFEYLELTVGSNGASQCCFDSLGFTKL
jgi:hypothetical protein